nr:mannosylglycoprotein endo-beta-mannosidase [Quercus suber]
MYRKHSLDVADILHPDDWKKCCHTIRSGLGLEGSYKPVKIFDLHLVSLFFDDFKRVYLHATTELENRRAWVAECSLNVQVTMGVEGNICLVEHLQTLHLSFLAGSHMQYMFPEFFFYNPDLWWPNGMGKQSLYNIHITIDVKGYGESNAWSHLFGFRKIESHIDSATGGRCGKSFGVLQTLKW